MGLLSKFEPRQAYLKMGIMGLAGSGKTFTATEVAIGLVELMRQRGLSPGPVAFVDTETGADWTAPRMKESGVELMVSRTRSLYDLIQIIGEATESKCSVLMIDSITHFWQVFCDEYAERRQRTRGLEFSDWAFLKKQWRVFTDAFVNSPISIIMCGRAGFEYDFFTNDAGKRELEKTGVKMKAETETGYEPSLLVLMEIEQELTRGDVTAVYRRATVMKDRSNTIDGKSFRNPKFSDFLPHIEYLSLAGAHNVTDRGDNAGFFTEDGKGLEIYRRKKERESCLEEITEVIKKHNGGQSKDDKEERGKLLEEIFGTRAWSRIEGLKLDNLQDGRNKLWVKLEGIPYAFTPPDPEAVTPPADV
jgi:hypothetical protein